MGFTIQTFTIILTDITVVNRKGIGPFLSIKQVKDYTGLSSSIIRRAVHKGYLKPSIRSGKLIFKQSNVDKWLGGK